MDDDTYFGLSTSSRSYQSTLKSQFDICFDFEDIEDDDEEPRGDYFCPLCSDDFDLVGLCRHIEEEHHIDSKSGVGTDLFGNIAAQHEKISNRLHRSKLRKGESHSTIQSLRKELQNGHFQSLLSRSLSTVSSPKMAPDPLLSFIYNMAPDVSESVKPDSTTRERTEDKNSYEKASETSVHKSSLPDKDHPEKAKRCEFVQGLMMSAIFFDDDGL